MKAMIYLLAGVMLTSFTVSSDRDAINGLWMGFYHHDMQREKVMVKFTEEGKVEFYAGKIEDGAKAIGDYTIQGDSVQFHYKTPEGKEYSVQGQMNVSKNFVDGVWAAEDQTTGKFYLEKQKIREVLAQP